MTLKLIMTLNAISCLVFGSVFYFYPSEISSLLGHVPHLILKLLGIVLLVNAAHLFWATLRKPHKVELLYFILGDFLWVLMTVIILIFQAWITTFYGVIASSITATMVGIFGYIQLNHYKKMFVRKKEILK